ncbi:uncharacterized protein FRV6_08217 [Fusarium oxysporum]|uniref:Secreted protein n=1 Tax=Fusarium oxysporum TaxID=5507 RepID=A0A2H3TH89_FUSOX|nr:uncharacterized protein FRV6_08217 [Fusarium oxysporum]
MLLLLLLLLHMNGDDCCGLALLGFGLPALQNDGDNDMEVWHIPVFADALLAFGTKQGVGFALGSSGPISDYLTILYSAHLLSSWVVFCPSRQPSQPDCVAPTALSTEKCHAPLLSPFPPRHLTSDQIHVSPMYLPTAHGCIPVGLHSKCPQNDLIFLLCYLLAADIS